MFLEDIRIAFEVIGIVVTAGFFGWLVLNIIRVAPRKPVERCPEWADEKRWEATK